MSQCTHCNTETGDRNLSLDRRVEVMSFETETPVLHVLASDAGMAFCGEPCFSKHIPLLIEQLELKRTFPEFDVVAECCRCGRLLDRRQAYVAFALLDATHQAKPWLKSLEVHSDEDFAILCPRCESPDFDLAESVEENLQPSEVPAVVAESV